MGDGHLEAEPRCGERAAQLVARISGEATLPLPGKVQTLEQVVHRGCQVLDLVAGGLLRQPELQVLGVHVVYLCRQ